LNARGIIQIGRYYKKDKGKNPQGLESDDKKKQTVQYYRRNTSSVKGMTSDTGYKISNDRCSLRAGKSEPLAFQDIHFLQKIISF